MLNENLKCHLVQCLSHYCSTAVQIENLTGVGRGSINEAYYIQTGNGNFFVKTNDAAKFPAMFEKEAKGLKILADTKTFYIPKVIAVDQLDESTFILMEYVETGKRVKNFYEDFGRRLALLHQHTNIYFGLDHDNFIGSLKQSNVQQKNGIMFFIHERLQPQLALAKRSRKIDALTLDQFEKLFGKLEDILPNEKSSLLHGDLWSGNFITATDGTACLIDPAVYYGTREADIAMTKLFGGFDPVFYESYNDIFPLQKDWQQRIDIWNLYPLLVHVNLFGGSYLAQVKSILNRFA